MSWSLIYCCGRVFQQTDSVKSATSLTWLRGCLEVRDTNRQGDFGAQYDEMEQRRKQHAEHGEMTRASQSVSDFEAEVVQRFVLTYRHSFDPIIQSSEAKPTLQVRLRNCFSGTGISSDTGWGCMIRSGQCLLANALRLLVDPQQSPETSQCYSQTQILARFADDPRAPFSIHRFVQHALTTGSKEPGEWFGPSTVASCIEALVEQSPHSNLRVFNDMRVSGTLVSFADMFAEEKTDERFVPCLMLFTTRLGIDNVHAAYWQNLKLVFCMPELIGIAGGRPSSSYYFFAQQDESLLCFDPHMTQPALPYCEKPRKYTATEIASCHTQHVKQVPIRELDPSMLIAFLVRDREELAMFRDRLHEFPDSNPIISTQHISQELSEEALANAQAVLDIEV